MDKAVYNQIKEDEPINVAPPEVATGGVIIAPSGIPFKGNAAVLPSKFSQTGINQITVGVGNSIQDAINAMNRAGGGNILLLDGTHTVRETLTLYSKINIIGETLNTTIAFTGGDYQFTLVGTNAYKVGTISANNNSQIVTGLGTGFVVAGVTTSQRILIRGIWYNIQSVDSATQITLSVPYSGRSISGETYVIADYFVLSRIENIIFTNTSINVPTMLLQYCSSVYFRNIEIQKGSVSPQGINVLDSGNIVFENVIMKGVTTAFDIRRSSVSATGITVLNDENTTRAILLSNNKDSFSSFRDVKILNGLGIGFDITESTNISIDGARILECSGKGIQLQELCEGISIINSLFENNGGDGIELTATSDNCFVANSSFIGNTGYGIDIAASTCDNNVLTGNFFSANTVGSINDSGVGTIIRSPSNQQYFGLEKQYYVMTNNSGAQRVAGEVVIMNPGGAVLNGFTTTTTQGDDKVLGVIAETIASLGAGRVQTLGNVTTLKINGTTAIAVGDLLGTFTTAGIAMKAVAGDMCFAIALEAYAVADSNGIIDALLITPRLI